jgi:chemotaxis protein MotB
MAAKAKKRGGGGGGHGGGWFVTFADLMGLLMSFFVMLVAYSSPKQEKMELVAGSMREAFGTQTERRNANIVEIDGVPVRPALRNVENVSPDYASDITAPKFDRRQVGLKVATFDQRFAMAAASLRQALQNLPDIAELSKSISVEQTPEGLLIQLNDQDGRSMFPEGSATPYERTRALLEAIAPNLRKLPNRIEITGHTSGARGAALPNSGAWQLSTNRALSVRDVLADSGVPDDRFAAVIGKADSQPLFPDDPFIASNRRVNILLLNEMPPLPANARP